jgi:peroxiredoxin Q/BCP
MASTPGIGADAPEITLPGTIPASGDTAAERRDFTLSAERGHPVVLAFYPGDETPVCTKQLCSYQSDLATLQGLNATLWGISSQDLDSHEKFQAHRGLSFPLLSDTDNDIFKRYGLGSLFNRRAVFVIDANGKIAWKHVSTTGLTFQKTDQIAAELRKLEAPTAAYPSEPIAATERASIEEPVGITTAAKTSTTKTSATQTPPTRKATAKRTTAAAKKTATTSTRAAATKKTTSKKTAAAKKTTRSTRSTRG